jgi:hypothetical protein
MTLSRRGRRVLVLELNELSPVLMDRFIAAGALPTFRRLREESHVYLTEAEERYPYLEPWIQWVTVHSGTPFAEHAIAHLNQGHLLSTKNVWDVFSEYHYRVLVCGSMNASYGAGLCGTFLPDPWTTKVAPHPTALAPFFDFIQKNVLEHSNDRVPVSKFEYARFVSFMVRHGLSRKTVTATAKQLAFERVTDRGRWRRATILDRLQADLFSALWKREEPAFATFFSNSVAHFQHLYWRDMEPALFASKPARADRPDDANAILYGYKQMDALVARMLELVENDTVVVFATALSQVPCLKFEEIGGKSYYRPRDLALFLRILGAPAGAVASPVMAHEFTVELASEEYAVAFAKRLASVRILGRVGMHVERRGKTVFTGCRIWETVPAETIVAIDSGGPTFRFFEVFYKVDGVKSGMHHPVGLLWIRRPDRTHAVHTARVPLTALAPTFLAMFSLPAPLDMKTPPLPGYARLIA